MFSHFLDFHSPVARPIPAQEPAAKVEPPQSIRIYRGIRYQKEPATTVVGNPPTGHERLVYRGIAYTKVPSSSGLDLPRRQKGVRIFRGLVVAQAD